MSGNDGLYGQDTENTSLVDHNSFAFQIAQALSAISTGTLVKIQKVSTTGEVAAIGTVDVLPLVNLVDGAMRPTKHVNVLKLPYMRNVGGSKGIILDPKVGDIGLVIFADRDISAAKKNKKQSPPGSKRRFNMADGMYVGTVIADAPTSYVRFGDDGTIYISPDNGTTLVTVKANDVTVAIGSTVLEVKPDEIHAKAGLEVWIRPTRVDLGMKDAPHKVMTADGPSEKVWAVISESP